MEDFVGIRSVDILHQLGLTEQMVRHHDIQPEHIKDARLDIDLRDPGIGGDDPSEPPSLAGMLYRLNVQKLSRELHALLSDCVAGYSMQLRRHGQTLFDRQWKKARLPGEGDVDWSSGVSMHVASVSKLITAMAMTKLLHSRNISVDAPILPWLPRYWHKGPGVDQITFRHLLNHTSGLVLANEPGPSDFLFMREQIALGAVGAADYRNMNYGLCRILISTIDAPYLFGLLGAGVNDAFWDATTIQYYARYVRENIFAPAGVTSTLHQTDNDALAYPFPASLPGRAGDNLSTWSGGAGWHLSVDDLLKVMAAFRRHGSIVDPARAQTMLDREFGLDRKINTPMGRVYAKGGRWIFGEPGNPTLQSNVFFLPQNMEMAILCNSRFCRPEPDFQDSLLNVIVNNIEVNRFAVTVAAAGTLAGLALVRKAQAFIIRR